MEFEFKEKEQRVISEDGIVLMSMLPEGLAEKWQEKAFKIIGRTKVELAAPDLLEALQTLQKQFVKDGIITGDLYDVCQKAIEKALK